MKKTFKKYPGRSQRGDALVVGIVCMAVLLVLGIGFVLLLNSQKEKPILTINQPKVSADDQLTDGKSNNELIQDVLILTAGNKRDEEQQKAAEATVNDEPQIVDDTAIDSTETTVEQDRLSALQTLYGKECDRRIAAIKDALNLQSKLSQVQRDVLEAPLNAEVSAISGLKQRASTETSMDAFMVDKTNLDKEYSTYLLLITQVKLLVWANDQTTLETKYNKLGGKFQERLNDASSKGASTSTPQITLNNYQAHKTNMTTATAGVMKDVPAIKPGDYNANRAVLKTFYSKLESAHKEMEAALTNSKDLVTAIQQLGN